jgi:Cu/Ag efflux protein CusF
MRDHTAFHATSCIRKVAVVASILFSVALAGCSSPKPAQEQPAEGPKRYHLSGRVVSVEPAKQQVVIDAGDIPGFMAAMTMGYAVSNPAQLAPLSAEDQVTADVVVNGSDVHLENIVVVKKADNAKPAAGSTPANSSQPSK